MKKYLLYVSGLFFFLFLQNILQAQVVKKITAAEKAKLGAMRKTPPMPKLSVAQKSKAEDYAHAATFFMAKALLNKSDPAKYPMDAPDGSMEKRSMDFVNTLSPTQLQRATERLKAILADDKKKTKAFGKYKTMDFTKASTTAEFKKASDRLVFSKAPTVNTNSAPPYTRIELYLNGVYCLQKTNVSASLDKVIVGGLVSGLHNEVNPGTPLYAGDFGAGSYLSGTYYFGHADLHPTESFPKKFYGYLLVVIYDGFYFEQDFANLSTQLQSLANQLSGLGSPEAFYHNYVKFSLANFADMLFWNNYLNITTLPVELSNLNAFGSDKISDYLNSGDIYGWSGRYQVFYSWKLIKD